MNWEFFIAKRLARSGNNSFTKVIIRIATAAVAISLAVMIITMATITGFKQQITEKIFGFWGHIHITDTSINQSYEPRPMDSQLPFLDTLIELETVEMKHFQSRADMENDSYTMVRSKAGIRHVQSFALAPGIINTKEDLEGILLKGVGKDFDWDTMSDYIVEGNPVRSNTEALTDDLLISEETAKRLHLKTGDRLIMNFIKDSDQLKRRFTICGIYKTGLVEYDQRFALVDIRKVQNVLGWNENQVGGYEVFIDDIDDLDLLNEYIYLDVLPATLYSETIRMKFPSIFEWLELQNINEDVILILMIIVSVLNMITALLILILERTNMIGALKALGSRNWSIRKIFLYHAAYIVVWGLLLGNVFGLGFCWLQKAFGFITLDEQSYYLSVAPIEINLMNILIMNMVALIIILTFLIIPSLLVTRITPVQALRYK